MDLLRVLIADDHPLFRHGIAALLQAASGFEVVGEATSGEEVVTLAEQMQPDVVLMDIRMPGISDILCRLKGGSLQWTSTGTVAAAAFSSRTVSSDVLNGTGYRCFRCGPMHRLHRISVSGIPPPPKERRSPAALLWD